MKPKNLLKEYAKNHEEYSTKETKKVFTKHSAKKSKKNYLINNIVLSEKENSVNNIEDFEDDIEIENDILKDNHLINKEDIKQKFIVDADFKGYRLDKFLTEKVDLTRSRINNLIETEAIMVNGKSVKNGYALKQNDEIVVAMPADKPLDLTPCDIPLDIIYQDDDLAVINKQKGLVVHPCQGTKDGTLVNALLFHIKNLSSINGVIRPGIVHRLDKNTSGLIVVAKNDKAHVELQKQISSKEAKRFYIALLDGEIKKESGIIETLIDRSKKDRRLMTVSDSGRIATTHFEVLSKSKHYTLVKFELKTGRTHQIRVHSKYIGHSISSDIDYGGKKLTGVEGQALHAYKLEFSHPKTKESMEFFAPLPEYFETFLSKINITLEELYSKLNIVNK